MKMKKLLLLVLLLPVGMLAQIRGIVKDTVTGKGIPYVSIRTDDNMFGTSADANGNFEIPAADASGGIEFSHVAYRIKHVRKVNQRDEIYLQKENTRPIQNAKLKQSTKKRSGEIPEDYDPTQTSTFFSKPTILAKYFPKLSRYSDTPYLNKVIVNVLSKKDGAVYKVRVFNATANGTPADDLLNEDIIVRTATGDKNAEIDLSKYGIRMPENGLFVGVETIIVAENIANIDWKPDNNDPDSKIRKDVYQPTFRGNSIRKGTLWRFMNGKWTHLTEKEKQKTAKGSYYPMNNLYLEIELSD